MLVGLWCRAVRLLRKQCCFSHYMVVGFVVWSLSLTLPFTGLVWQLMRAYTLSILRQLAGGDSLINDAAIIEWANAKVNQHVTLSLFSSFSSSLSRSLALWDNSEITLFYLIVSSSYCRYMYMSLFLFFWKLWKSMIVIRYRIMKIGFCNVHVK